MPLLVSPRVSFCPNTKKIIFRKTEKAVKNKLIIYANSMTPRQFGKYIHGSLYSEVGFDLRTET